MGQGTAERVSVLTLRRTPKPGSSNDKNTFKVILRVPVAVCVLRGQEGIQLSLEGSEEASLGK